VPPSRPEDEDRRLGLDHIVKQVCLSLLCAIMNDPKVSSRRSSVGKKAKCMKCGIGVSDKDDASNAKYL